MSVKPDPDIDRGHAQITSIIFREHCNTYPLQQHIFSKKSIFAHDKINDRVWDCQF